MQLVGSSLAEDERSFALAQDASERTCVDRRMTQSYDAARNGLRTDCHDSVFALRM